MAQKLSLQTVYDILKRFRPRFAETYKQIPQPVLDNMVQLVMDLILAVISEASVSLLKRFQARAEQFVLGEVVYGELLEVQIGVNPAGHALFQTVNGSRYIMVEGNRLDEPDDGSDRPHRFLTVEEAMHAGPPPPPPPPQAQA